MANVSANSTEWNLPNYVGEFLQLGQKRSPFITYLGGMEAAMVHYSMEFVMGNYWSPETPSQPDISETSSLTAPTTVTYVPDQKQNVCQIYQRQINLSYIALSEQSRVEGVALSGNGTFTTGENKLDKQVEANLKQVALDLDYTCINGTYERPANSAASYRTRGIVTAVDAGSTTVAAGSVDLSQDLVNSLITTMSDTSDFERPVIWVNAFQLHQLNGIYGFAPEHRMIGGVDIRTILLPIVGEVEVIFEPRMPTDTLLLADMAKCGLVFTPVPDTDNGGYKGVLFLEKLSKAGASSAWQLYGQIGLDYGHEHFHGTITGLTTS